MKRELLKMPYFVGVGIGNNAQKDSFESFKQRWLAMLINWKILLETGKTLSSNHLLLGGTSVQNFPKMICNTFSFMMNTKIKRRDEHGK
jgi:hypothetical protein